MVGDDDRDEVALERVPVDKGLGDVFGADVGDFDFFGGDVFALCELLLASAVECGRVEITSVWHAQFDGIQINAP